MCAPACRFVMFYEGVDDTNRRSIGIAVSKNGKSGWKCHSRRAAVVPNFGKCGLNDDV